MQVLETKNEGAYDALEALNVIDRTEGDRTMHGECAGRTCPSKNDGRFVRQNCEDTEKVSLKEGRKDSRDQSNTTSSNR